MLVYVTWDNPSQLCVDSKYGWSVTVRGCNDCAEVRTLHRAPLRRYTPQLCLSSADGLTMNSQFHLNLDVARTTDTPKRLLMRLKKIKNKNLSAIFFNIQFKFTCSVILKQFCTIVYLNSSLCVCMSVSPIAVYKMVNISL